jgi:hypothetical protein
MKRRQFLKMGAAGTAAVFSPGIAWSQSASGPIRLTIEPVDNEMIDGYMCYMLAFFREGEEARPLLRAQQGSTVEIEVTNRDDVVHGFAITGVPLANALEIAPGETRRINFKAPAAGSYIYYDPTNDPVNRLVGLQGALVIDPQQGATPTGSPTPYGRGKQTPAIQKLFDALGTSSRFPGEKWKPNDPHREKIWVFSQTDPALNEKVRQREAINGAGVKSWFLPRYFHINWLSGFDTAVHGGTRPEAVERAEAIMPSARQGQPVLIRTMNGGLCAHSPHIHGNHVMLLTRDDEAGRVVFENNIWERDVWRLEPLQRKDVLLPFERPPDIPIAKWPPREEPFPMRYVMHCHCEMSQTAAGGNYPQGLVTHWEMTGAI